MTDLRELLREADVEPSQPLDVDAVFKRAAARRQASRRRRAIGAITAGVLVLGGGILLGTGDGDEQSVRSVPASQSDEARVPPSVGSASSTSSTTATPHDGAANSTTTGAPQQSPQVESQVSFSDASGDTASLDPWAVPGTTRTPEPALDITSASVARHGDALRFRVAVADLTEGPPPGADGVAFDFAFTYRTATSEQRLHLDMQRYNGHQHVRFFVDEGAQRCVGCAIRLDPAADVIEASVPMSALAGVLRTPSAEGRLDSFAVSDQWVHTKSDASDCSDPERLTGCSGPYAATAADDATAPADAVLSIG